MSGKSIPVTRKPSLTSWRRMTAKAISQAPPTAKVTTSTGRYQRPPWARQARMLSGENPSPSASMAAVRQPGSGAAPWAIARFACSPVL